MITLLQNGEIYSPQSLGRQSVLLTDGRIAKVGDVDPRAVEALDVDHEIVDLDGCLVMPGLIDPHEHLLGGSGEGGFSTQSPEITFSEIVQHGITTVVGTLGVDTTMKTMAGLLAKAKALEEHGLNAYIWSGGYTLPPTSIMGSVREDIMFLDEVIGVGEIAIADRRGMEPTARELARVATDAYVGGMLARKAGITHLHVGEGRKRLAVLRDVLEDFEVEPSWLYATHVERSTTLMDEAIALTRRGMAVDIDVVDGDLAKWLRYYREHGGDPCCLTFSTDASAQSPRALYEQLCRAVIEGRFALEDVLPLVTSNAARILKLERKGSLQKGSMADILVLERGTMDIVHVLSRGEWMVRDGDLLRRERFLEDSDRSIVLIGEKGLTE